MPRERPAVRTLAASFFTLTLSLLCPPSTFAGPTGEAESLSAANGLTFVFGVETGCRAAAADVVEAFLEGVAVLEDVCDAQNASTAASGQRACPPSTCLSTIEPGGTEPPRLEVDVSLSRNTSASVVGFPASSYISSGAQSSSGTISGGAYSAGGGSPGSNLSSQGIVVRVKLTVTLGKQPDKLVCVNPMSQAARDGLLAKIVDLSSRGVDCESKP